jgi:hypothetical protein
VPIRVARPVGTLKAVVTTPIIATLLTSFISPASAHTASAARAAVDVAAATANLNVTLPSPDAAPGELEFGNPVGVTTAHYTGKGGNAAVFTLKPGHSEVVIPTKVPSGGTLVQDGLGGFKLMVGGTMVGYLYQPWARDAAGKMLSTSYRWNGRQLIQHVSLDGAKFPVVADPHYTCSFWSGCQIQFNKHDTQTLAYGSSVASWFPWTMIAGRYLWVWAAIAMSQGKCIRIANVFWVYIYSGGYCT